MLMQVSKDVALAAVVRANKQIDASKWANMLHLAEAAVSSKANAIKVDAVGHGLVNLPDHWLATLVRSLIRRIIASI